MSALGPKLAEDARVLRGFARLTLLVGTVTRLRRVRLLGLLELLRDLDRRGVAGLTGSFVAGHACPSMTGRDHHRGAIPALNGDPIAPMRDSDLHIVVKRVSDLMQAAVRDALIGFVAALSEAQAETTN